jgi:peptidyl-prolyl cis-trans isomerase C
VELHDHRARPGDEQESDMRTTLTAGLLAGLAIAMPIAAQEDATEEPAAEAAAPAETDAAPAETDAVPAETDAATAGAETEAAEGESDQAPAEAAGTDPAEAATEVDASTVLATVDGTEITLGHVIAMRERLPEQYQQVPDEVLLQGILEQLVDQTLLAATVSTDPSEDPRAVQLHLENERRGSLAARAVEAGIVSEVEEAEIEAAYEEAYADFEPQPEFNASHILVETEEQAQEIRAELEGGADFAALAEEHSTDPGSAANGGNLGWFGPGRMVPPFEAAVTELEQGEVSEPVQTQFGWHLIRLEDERLSGPPPLEAVRDQLESQIGQERLQAELEELRAGAEVELVEPGIDPSAIRDTGMIED